LLGQELSKSTTALGLPGVWFGNRNGSRCTGKERDETGLDYFGARYYSNGLARFITPDWAAKAANVPYAKFSDPQSLNLYGYVDNGPLNRVDADGHSFNYYPGADIRTPGYLCETCGYDGSGSQLGPQQDVNGKPYFSVVQQRAQQQNGTGASNSPSTTEAQKEQHQYDLVVNRVNKLLGSDDAADHIDSDGKLVGGNYEFSINHNDKSDIAFQRALNKALGEADGDTGAHGGLTPPTHRLGFSTSLHHDNDGLHVDHFNGAKFPVGTLLHAIVDVGFGHLPYYGSNHAFSYAGVQ
jgi:RHS repeat-associated protein